MKWSSEQPSALEETGAKVTQQKTLQHWESGTPLCKTSAAARHAQPHWNHACVFDHVSLWTHLVWGHCWPPIHGDSLDYQSLVQPLPGERHDAQLFPTISGVASLKQAPKLISNAMDLKQKVQHLNRLNCPVCCHESPTFQVYNDNMFKDITVYCIPHVQISSLFIKGSLVANFRYTNFWVAGQE